MKIWTSIILFIFVAQLVAPQYLIRNPDFETGDLTGWNNWENGITGVESEVYRAIFRII